MRELPLLTCEASYGSDSTAGVCARHDSRPPPKASPIPTELSDSSESSRSVMRIAIAGTGGLALIIANYILRNTSHPLLLLSRSVKSALSMPQAGSLTPVAQTSFGTTIPGLGCRLQGPGVTRFRPCWDQRGHLDRA